MKLLLHKHNASIIAGNGNHVHFYCTSFGCAMRVIFGILTLQTLCSSLNSLVNDAFGVTCTLTQNSMSQSINELKRCAQRTILIAKVFFTTSIYIKFCLLIVLVIFFECLTVELHAIVHILSVPNYPVTKQKTVQACTHKLYEIDQLSNLLRVILLNFFPER